MEIFAGIVEILPKMIDIAANALIASGLNDMEVKKQLGNAILALHAKILELPESIKANNAKIDEMIIDKITTVKT